MYDYGARFYMADVGIWGQYHPLAEITFQPYAYAYNNPIFYNDPTGMIGEDAVDCCKEIKVPGGTVTDIPGSYDVKIDEVVIKAQPKASTPSSSLGAFMGGGNGVVQMNFQNHKLVHDLLTLMQIVDIATMVYKIYRRSR